MTFASATLHPVEMLPDELAADLARAGEPRYRASQIFSFIHGRGVLDPDAMTNLPKALRADLTRAMGKGPLEVAQRFQSDDGTRKLLVRMEDGRQVETVLIPQLRRAGPDLDEADLADDEATGLVPGSSVTQCVSSQVGCAMACAFCASGIAGLARNMSAAEIVAQVLVARRHLVGEERIRNVVFMGMGEPLHNYDRVVRAVRLLTHPDGMGLSPRRITVSTSGLVPQIDRLAEDFGGQVGLAISLHAVRNALRSKLMPVNRKHTLEELLGALRRYPLPRGRRITIEYTLMRGLNDAVRDADTLSRLLAGIPVKVNLIPMNPVRGSDLEAPEPSTVDAFRSRLRKRDIPTFVRRQRGDDIDAACGQLALHGAEGRRRVKRGL